MRSVSPRDATMAGEILFRYDDTVVDLATAEGEALRQARKRVQMIFQDPESSLNPRMTIRDIIGEPLLVNGLARGRELDDRVVELMGAVSLDPSTCGATRTHSRAASGSGSASRGRWPSARSW